MPPLPKWESCPYPVVRAELIASGLEAILGVGVGAATGRLASRSEFLRAKALPDGTVGSDGVGQIDILGALESLLVDLPEGWCEWSRPYEVGGQQQAGQQE